MLQLRGITKIYKSKSGQETSALDGISLDMEYGQMVFVVGKSGCGKSTLLNIIGGLDLYDRGELIIDGISTKEFSDVDFDYYRNKYIGFVFQEYNLLEEDNIEKNITLSQKLQKTPVDKVKTEALLKRLGLEGFGGRMPDELSGGQKQRAAIARALIKSPEIILADEPTGALDAESGVQILDILKEISKEKLVIVVSHDKEYAAKYAARIIELSDGKIISDVIKKGADFVPTPALPDEIVFESAPKENIQPSEGKKETASFATIAVRNPEMAAGRKSQRHSKKGTGFAEKGAGLSVKEACKIGISGLKRRKMRLIVSIFLASIATFLFGMCSAFFVYNENKVILNSMYDSGVYFAEINKYISFENAYSHKVSKYRRMTDEDINTFQQQLPNHTIVPELNIYTSNYGTNKISCLADLGKENKIFTYNSSLSGAMEVNEDIAAKFKFKLLSGSFPATDNEILVSDFIYMLFERFGYRDPTTDIVTKINSYDDLVGKIFHTENIDKLTGGFKIAGILDTNLDKNRYKEVLEAVFPDGKDEIPGYNYDMHNSLDYELSECGHRLIFLKSGHYANRANLIKSYENIKNTSHLNAYFNSILNDLSDVSSYAGVHMPAISKMEAFPYRAIKDAETPLIEGFPYDVYWKGGIEKKTLSDDEVVVPMSLLQKVLSLNEKTPEEIIADLENSTLSDFMYNIYSIDDIGKNKKQVKIAGIYTIEESAEYEYTSSMFVSDDNYNKFIEKYYLYDYYGVAIALNGNYNSDREIFKNSFISNSDMKINGEYNIFSNNFTIFIRQSSNALAVVSWILLGAGGLMAIFAGVMIFNYFAVSIGDKKKEIGILRAMGARKIDIFNIFMSRGLVIALINSAIAIILTAIGITVLNYILKTKFLLYITIVSFNYLSVIMILGLSLITMFLGSIFPIYRISKQPPAIAMKSL